MKSTKALIGVVGIFVLCAFLASGCGKKAEEKTAEKVMGNVLTEATGKETRVELNGDNVRIEGKDSTTEIASTSAWPPEMFEDVPKFTGGAIERVVSSNESGMKKFNVYLTNIKDGAVKEYAGALKAKGWEASLMEMDKAAMLNAQKGNLGINFTYSAEEKDGMLAVYSTQ
jgi:hypothetical protein